MDCTILGRWDQFAESSTVADIAMGIASKRQNASC